MKSAKIPTLTNEFYSIIPHDFGMTLPPPINFVGTVK